MDWLSQNWLWIALWIGAVFFMTRMGGCGMSHAGGHQHDAGGKTEQRGGAGAGGSGPDNQQRQSRRHGCC